MMRAMKYVVFVPDGCADVPLRELGDLTPLEAARMVPSIGRDAGASAPGGAASRRVESGDSPGLA